ncbi:Uncharacterised protein [Pannonibacter phragmitetus]|uniref:Uncharacterized protein n=1 Tax=Pannonibacter phragmitetus TaxID=121719 RepID=A0A379HLL1_9HYPH|nr:Imm42 family immunity protein [Pannonibacter phragmitetus]SUC82802.1 Uncharacterised protein [Pannonibacter phragmitetus]
MYIIVSGNQKKFAIESGVENFLSRPSQRALGYFIIYVKDKIYGVRKSDATLLACSFDAIQRRLERRGTHVSSFGFDLSAGELVHHVYSSIYEDPQNFESVKRFTLDQIRDDLIRRELIMAPDGDAAFDDGSHIVQFDCDNQVRLVAFRNPSLDSSEVHSIDELYIDSDEFYKILENWRDSFIYFWEKEFK